MKFNLYKIQEKLKDYGGWRDNRDTHHKLILLKTFDSYVEAEEWLKVHHEKYVIYTILPTYYFTHYDEQS